jgi:hypothetical protein
MQPLALLGKLLSLLLLLILLDKFVRKSRRKEMPVASISDVPIRFELKSLPDGYVVIRRRTYGERLNSLEQSSEQEMSGDQKTKSVKVAVKNLIRRTQELAFAQCIVDHNLTWMNGAYEVPFDFKNDKTAFDRLDSRIAEEIDGYISKVNDFIEDDDQSVIEGKEVSTLDSSTES